MSAMEDMLANMLKKALPQEVMGLLTPEKIQELAEKVNAYIIDTRESLDEIKQNTSCIEQILSRLDCIEEELKNVTSKGSGKSSKRSAGNSGGNGSGE